MYTENAQPDQIFSTALTGIQRASLSLNASRLVMSLALVIGDLSGLLAAGLLAIAARSWLLGAGLPYNRASWLLVLSALGVLIYAWRGLYPSIGLGVIEEFKRLITGTTLAFVIFAAVIYMLQPALPFSRFVYAGMFLLSLVLVPVNRSLMRHLLARLGLWGEPAAVIGPPEAVRKVADYLQREPKSGLRPAVLLIPGPDGLHELVVAGQRVRKNNPLAGIQIALVLYQPIGELDAIRERYRDAFERVVLVSEHGNGHELTSVTVKTYGGLIGLKIRHSLLDGWSQSLKRLMDLSLSAAGLLALAPLLGLLGLLLKLGAPGPVFYRQKRLGKGGREFEILKFRTMYPNADQVLADYLAQDPALKAEWDTYQKLACDPRLTRIGALLRRFSLDELPQLWNVLRGEMSLVGPRPIMLDQRELYGANFTHYMRVSPGITGLWQISGRNQASYTERTEFDVRYVNTWSVWLDIYILVRTAWVVLRAQGAC